MQDLSNTHHPLLAVFNQPASRAEWGRHRLSAEQLEFYHQNGYLAGVRMLDDEQVELLRNELAELVNPDHPGRLLFYEYNSNESADPSKILFHALGAWRVSSGFHDLLWNPAFLVPASQLLGGPVRFWHDQIFYKPAHHGGVVAWHQDYSYWTRTQPWPIFPVGSGWMIPHGTTAVSITCPVATVGTFCRSRAWLTTWTRLRLCFLQIKKENSSQWR